MQRRLGLNSTITRRAVDLVPRLLLGALLILIFSRIVVPAVGTFRDDGIYLSSARALAQGKGYVIDILPGSPPNTKYPPLTSAFLAVPYRFGFDPLHTPAVFKAIPFGFLLLWLGGLRLLCLTAGLSRNASVWVLCCTAASSMTAYCATMALSDVPAAALVTWALYFALSSEIYEKNRIRNVLWAGTLFGLSVLARTSMGFAVLGVLVTHLIRRRWLSLILSGGVCIAMCLPWFAWTWIERPTSDPVMSYYTGQNYRDWWAWRAGDDGCVGNSALLNLMSAVLQPAAFVGFARVVPGVVFGALLLGLAIVGACASTSRFLLLITTVTSIACSLLWLWPPGRMLLFVYPILFLLAARVKVPPTGKWIAVGFAFLYCVMGLSNQITQVGMAFADGNPPFMSNKADNWLVVQRMSDWLRERTKGSVTIGALQEGSWSLLTGSPAVFPAPVRPCSLFYGGKLPPLGTHEDLQDAMNRLRIKYVVLTPSRAFAEGVHFRGSIEKLAQATPHCLRKAVDFGGGYLVYEYTYSPLSP